LLKARCIISVSFSTKCPSFHSPIFTFLQGRDSAVGIATRYGLNGPGIGSRWGRDFPHPGAHPASYTMGTGSLPGVKRPWRGVDHPPPSSAVVKERVELYLYSPSGPSWPVLWRTLPLSLYRKSAPLVPEVLTDLHQEFKLQKFVKSR
jgi:hypothetical protein